MSTTANLGARKPAVADQGKEVTISESFDKFDALAKGFITGLRLSWLSGTGVRVGPGSATVRSAAADGSESGELLAFTADKDKTGLSLSNNTTYHVYLYNNGGTVDVEIVTTAPANHFGTAYQKAGDATRRYLGSVRTNGSGNIYKFQHSGHEIFYLEDVAASPFRCLSAGTATSETSVSLSAVLPATAVSAHLTTINTSDRDLMVGHPDDTSSIGLLYIPPAAEREATSMPVSSSQAVNYKLASAPTSGAAYIDVRGYVFER